ncbi:MAG: CPCC family cysteine-rich protein [Lacrimispora sphenoides]
MKKYQCPCCGYYTFESDSKAGPLFDYCDICLWQYDEVAHDKPDTMIGANSMTLKQAQENFKKYGVCKPEHKNMVREPLEEELPENN